MKSRSGSVLQSLGSIASRKTYGGAIEDFISWYCSEPRLAFGRTVVLYLAFAEATQPLGYGVRNREALDLAKSENRGFQEAATAYARGSSKLQ